MWTSKSAVFLFLAALTLQLAGCATTAPSLTPHEVSRKIADINAKGSSAPLNPRNGEEIWNGLRVGMTVQEVLNAVPNSYFDDQWSSSGAVGAMAEAGIFAKDKVLVTGEIVGPFGGPSTFYGLFDDGGRLDGVVILTLKKGLPDAISKLYGSIGFNLAEFKEASRMLIKDAPPSLGMRVGAPRLGREPVESIGTVGVAKATGSSTAVGVGIPLASMSPSTIAQRFRRDGFKSTFEIRTMYLGLYRVYAAPLVVIGIQAKRDGVDEVPEVE